jgi:hypothetical protein
MPARFALLEDPLNAVAAFDDTPSSVEPDDNVLIVVGAFLTAALCHINRAWNGFSRRDGTR